MTQVAVVMTQVAVATNKHKNLNSSFLKQSKISEVKITEQGKSKKLKGKRKKKNGGLKPTPVCSSRETRPRNWLLNLFMEQNKNICFEIRSTRNNTSLSNPLNLFMGIIFLLFTS
ncbi:hypothetical protein LC593_31670 [Nostoc sp. CHAB 5844]|nr:hypothetical protein [Nostoc sp. CHAB 5844]